MIIFSLYMIKSNFADDRNTFLLHHEKFFYDENDFVYMIKVIFLHDEIFSTLNTT